MKYERTEGHGSHPRPPKSRRGRPQQAPNAMDGEKLLKLLNIPLWDPKRHYQADLGEHLRCSEQTTLRYVAKIKPTLTGSLTIDSGSYSPRGFYQLFQPATADNLGGEDQEVRYLPLCRDLHELWGQREAFPPVDMTAENAWRCLDRPCSRTQCHCYFWNGVRVAAVYRKCGPGRQDNNR
jgi:hypothetical protein